MFRDKKVSNDQSRATGIFLEQLILSLVYLGLKLIRSRRKKSFVSRLRAFRQNIVSYFARFR